MKPVIASLLLFALPAAAQQVGQNVSTVTGGTPTITVTSQLVVEAVSVKDKKGNPISGLTQKDFKVTEDGAPQDIRVFEYQSLPEPKPVPPPPPSSTENVKIYNTLAHFQIQSEPLNSGKYRDKRLIALYFDMSAMPPGDQFRALSSAEKFVRTQMQPQDMFAILRYSGSSVDVLQDFTDDRSRLLSILETLVVGEGQGYDNSTSGDAATPDAGAAFGQDDGEFNIFNTDRQLAALQTAANMLGRINEKKSLIYYVSGMRLNGLDNQAQLHATINSAIRSGVTLWPIDARGLTAAPPLGDATQGSPGGAAMYTGTAAMAMVNRLQQSQDTLYSLGSDTGGKALLDNNDLSRGILDAERSVSSYYIIGYYTTNTNKDGKFRRIKITLNSDVAADLDYRQGYYANKEFNKFTVADKDRQLEDALMLKDPITELTIAMEVDYFQINHAEYFVPVIMKIPGSELALAKKGGAQQTVIDFIGEIKDSYGSTIQNIRDRVPIKLSDATAEVLARSPLEYDTGYTILPGKYTIKVLARDDETGRIGTYQANFTIPNLVKEATHIPISSIVLSSERHSTSDAIFNAQKDKDRAKTEAVNPLVVNGMKLQPSVTRVFSKTRDLYVYLQAYQEPLPLHALPRRAPAPLRAARLRHLLSGAEKSLRDPAH